MSAYLQRMRGKSAGEPSRFLLSRGLWLIVVEIVVLRLLGVHRPDYISAV